MGKFSDYLEMKGLSKETQKTYIKRIRYFSKYPDLKGKSKNYINQTKNALKHYHICNDDYINLDVIKLSKLHDKTKKNPRKPEETLYLKKINSRINALKDKRKKLAFRLQQISGLRISEISNLEKNDIVFAENNRLIITVQKGKGNKSRILKTIEDKYIYENLKLLDPRKNNKLFHSASTLMKKANELGFKSHRLRKVFSDQINLKFSGTSKEKRELLQKLLGHGVSEKNKTYKKYIDTNINYEGTKFDIN